MNLTPMDYIRGAIANAQAEGLTIDDLAAMAEHATTPKQFDHAVNTLVQTQSNEARNER